MNAITETGPAEKLNGIDVEVVQALAAAAADPAEAATHWKVATAWERGTRSLGRVAGFELGGRFVERGFTIGSDEPAVIGGGDVYANPQELLIAALNGCMSVGFVALCALHGVAVESLEITTEGDLDLRGFFALAEGVSPGFDALSSTIKVKGAANEAQFQEIFQMMLATSPNVHNITKPIALSTTLEVV